MPAFGQAALAGPQRAPAASPTVVRVGHDLGRMAPAAISIEGRVRSARREPRAAGPRVADAVLVTTGRHAYRDRDGIAVVPAALLGP